MVRPSNREFILDAFEELVTLEGTGCVTLDAVAERAGVSKGGLLYHFPSKADLLRGFGDRLVTRVARLVSGAPTDPAEVVRWYLGNEIQGDEERSTFRSLVAALHASGAGIDEMVHEALRLFREPLEILDPVLAALVHLVGEGLYLNQLLGVPGPPSEIHEQIVAELTRRAEGPDK